MPLSTSNGSDAPNCYICCPSVAYIDYGIEETRHFDSHPVIKTALTGIIRANRPLIRATGLDHQVQPNNWLFSTNPVPDLTQTDIEQMRDDLVARFPDRAIVLRSLNDLRDPEKIEAFEKAGFLMLPARQVYVFDPRHADMSKADFKRDQTLLSRTDYRVVEGACFADDDFDRAAELYGQLYLQKYTPLNPDYTPLYLKSLQANGLIRLFGLQTPNGRIDGILGLFENADTLTVPIIGYDTGLPKKLGLYRMLSALAQKHAIDENKVLNFSAGAAEFKRKRGSVPTIEVSAVYVAHLHWRKRLATRSVKALLDRIGVPIMKRFEL
ncbi:GNAT family N-acetyltransferase [Pseudaestuariivita rosea]|uniref:GNAT family N-acetyltransferase n=1 Tax=Pseudaestuariivita rosea TaxID=2763263 RepID=UPI001ABAA424|nr:GNAT family N-acetyltransferase [Pseudaestuariivita rosea]